MKCCEQFNTFLKSLTLLGRHTLGRQCLQAEIGDDISNYCCPYTSQAQSYGNDVHGFENWESVRSLFDLEGEAYACLIIGF